MAMKKWLINPQRFDRYSYALNNPLRYTDPTGLSTLVCCDPNCNQLCEDDDAQNSNPGGTEGSPQYSTDPPEEDPEEETDEDPEEETDEEKRKRLQKECIEECKEDKEVVKLFNEIKALKNKRLAAGVFGVAGCGILGALTFGTVALACGIAFFYSTLDSGWSIDRYEKEIRKKGCSCVLGEDEL